MTAADALPGDQVWIDWHMSDARYHADPVLGGSLSFSGSKLLIPPNAPAIYKAQIIDGLGREDTSAFSHGRAAHSLVLGAGPEPVDTGEDEWRTAAIKDRVAKLRAEGKVPLKPKDYRMVQDMAAALRDHPTAGTLLEASAGDPEVSIFWPDEGAAGFPITRRARIDYVPDLPGLGRGVILDYKTCVSSSPAAFPAAFAKYGYHEQAAWYEDGARMTGLCEDPVMLYIAQMKKPPYLVVVYEPTRSALEVGREMNRKAIDRYAAAKQSGHWPGFTDEILPIDLPRWYDGNNFDLETE